MGLIVARDKVLMVGRYGSRQAWWPEQKVENSHPKGKY